MDQHITSAADGTKTLHIHIKKKRQRVTEKELNRRLWPIESLANEWHDLWRETPIHMLLFGLPLYTFLTPIWFISPKAGRWTANVINDIVNGIVKVLGHIYRFFFRG